MHAMMANTGTVRLSDPRADEARPGALAMIAVSAGGLGLLLVVALASAVPEGSSEPMHRVRVRVPTAAHPQLPPAAGPDLEPPPAAAQVGSPDLDREPNPGTDRARRQSADQAKPVGTGAKGAKVPAPSASRDAPAQPPSAEGAGAAAQAASTRVSTGAKRRTKPTFEPGVVAYVRCEGSEKKGARFPCPRDRKLEEIVWQVLAGLAQCNEPDLGRGSAELRLTLESSRVVISEWKPAVSGPTLNLRAVAKCLTGKLGNTRTSLTGRESVVSFRFGLK